MPFMGVDWRSPGDGWVRGEGGGWMKVKVLRKQILNALCYAHLCSKHQNSDNTLQQRQDHIILKETGVSLAEALLDLHMVSSVKIQNRFAYVTSLTSFLIENKFSTLSGSGQQCVLNMASAIVDHCVKNNTHNREARNLTNLLKTTLQNNKHDHIGSSLLWQQHWQQLHAMEQLLKQAQQDLLVDDAFSKDNDSQLKLQHLPPEMLHSIFLQLVDHEDLSNAIDSFQQPIIASSNLTSISSIGSTKHHKQPIVTQTSSKPINIPQKQYKQLSHSYQDQNICSHSSYNEPQHIHTTKNFLDNTPQHSNTTSQQNFYENPQQTCVKKAMITSLKNQPSSSYESHAFQLSSSCPTSSEIPNSHWLKLHLAEESYFKRLVLRKFPSINQWKQVLWRKGFQSWKDLHYRCSLRYKEPKNFSNSVVMCRRCRAMYWKLEGHTCIDENSHQFVMLSPEQFVRLLETP